MGLALILGGCNNAEKAPMKAKQIPLEDFFKNPEKTSYRISPDGKTPVWSGDVWKTIVHLRSARPDVHVFVLDCDHGIGVVAYGPPENMLQISGEKIETMSYQHLEENRVELLNLKPPEYLTSFLDDRLLRENNSS